MDHIPMMDQDRMEEGCCCRSGSDCQSHQQRYNNADHFMQQTRLMQLTRFIVAGFMFVVTVLLALLVLFIFMNRHGGLFGCQEHTPSADTLPATSAQQQKQVQQRQNPSQNPSAYLPVSIPTKEQHHLVWEDRNGDHVHLRGDFSYSDGYLIVPRNGLYRVYLQITYEYLGNCDICDTVDDKDESLMLYHVVYHVPVSYNKNWKLLSAVHTVKCDVKNWRKSIYSAGSFELKAKDKLWVNSSHPKLIVEKADQVFFGVDFQYD